MGNRSVLAKSVDIDLRAIVVTLLEHRHKVLYNVYCVGGVVLGVQLGVA